MSDFLYLKFPLHPNYFVTFKIPDESRDAFLFSFEGAIQGVKESAVKSLLSTPEILNVRLGYAKAPKKMKIESMDDLLKLVAMMVEL
jgi:hypothetical protein